MGFHPWPQRACGRQRECAASGVCVEAFLRDDLSLRRAAPAERMPLLLGCAVPAVGVLLSYRGTWPLMLGRAATATKVPILLGRVAPTVEEPLE